MIILILNLYFRRGGGANMMVGLAVRLGSINFRSLTLLCVFILEIELTKLTLDIWVKSS